MKNKYTRIILLLFILLFFILKFANMIQDNYFTQRDLKWDYNNIVKYCHMDSMMQACDTSLNISNLKNFDIKITVNYRPHNVFFVILKNICIFSSLILFIIFILLNINREKSYTTNKYSLKIIFLFAAFSAYKFFYLYANNILKVPFHYILLIAAGAFAIYFTLFAVFKFILKSENAAILYSLIITYFIYNNLYCNLENFLLSLFLLMLAFIYSNDDIIKILKYFAVTILSLVIINGITKLFTNIHYCHDLRLKPLEYKLKKYPNRNIYVILLDMYAGRKTLQYYGFDNSEFIESLKKRGFTVYDNIDSNYNKTALSITTTLNLKYLEDIEYDNISDSINNADLLRILKSVGYKIYYINSWPMDMHIKNGYIDHVYEPSDSGHNQIMTLFFHDTAFVHIGNLFTNTNYIVNTFSYLNNIIKNSTDRKNFIFAHFLMPHDPFLYNAKGELNSDEDVRYIKRSDGTSVINKKSYVEYLKYTNNQILGITDKLLAKKNKPIIIITGDHGSREINSYNDILIMSEVAKYHDYTFNTMLAYYNPDIAGFNHKNDCLLNFYINFVNDNFGTSIKNVNKKKLYVYNGASVENIHNLAGVAVK